MTRTWVSLLFPAILSLSAAAAPAADPAALVREFYERHPHELHGGLPRGADLQWLSGWISGGLYARFRDTAAYQDAWIRRYDTGHDDLKPPFADGVSFTGVPDVIDGFEVEGAEALGDGEWHVPVRFCIQAAPGWEARVVVKEERARLVIDDIVFFPMHPGDRAWTLSEILDSRDDE